MRLPGIWFWSAITLGSLLGFGVYCGGPDFLIGFLVGLVVIPAGVWLSDLLPANRAILWLIILVLAMWLSPLGFSFGLLLGLITFLVLGSLCLIQIIFGSNPEDDESDDEDEDEAEEDPL